MVRSLSALVCSSRTTGSSACITGAATQTCARHSLRSMRHPSHMSEAVVKVVIADDHAVVRSGLRMLLEAEGTLEVVAEAGDVETAARMVRAHRPGVAVLDLNMPGGS